MEESKKNKNTQELVEPMGLEGRLQKKQKAASILASKMSDLIRLDENMPTGEIARYLASICICEIETTTGDPRQRWCETLNRVLNTEHRCRKDATGTTDERSEYLKDIFEAADTRNRFEKLENQIIDLKVRDVQDGDEPINGAGQRPKDQG